MGKESKSRISLRTNTSLHTILNIQTHSHMPLFREEEEKEKKTSKILNKLYSYYVCLSRCKNIYIYIYEMLLLCLSILYVCMSVVQNQLLKQSLSTWVTFKHDDKRTFMQTERTNERNAHAFTALKSLNTQIILRTSERASKYTHTHTRRTKDISIHKYICIRFIRLSHSHSMAHCTHLYICGPIVCVDDVVVVNAAAVVLLYFTSNRLL